MKSGSDDAAADGDRVRERERLRDGDGDGEASLAGALAEDSLLVADGVGEVYRERLDAVLFLEALLASFFDVLLFEGFVALAAFVVAVAAVLDLPGRGGEKAGRGRFVGGMLRKTGEWARC